MRRSWLPKQSVKWTSGTAGSVDASGGFSSISTSMSDVYGTPTSSSPTVSSGGAQQQHGLPATRQTSIEFLTALAKAASFSSEEKSLLEDFLNRCDLIKFARYEATTSDSELLLQEAIRFVKGGQLATV